MVDAYKWIHSITPTNRKGNKTKEREMKDEERKQQNEKPVLCTSTILWENEAQQGTTVEYKCLMDTGAKPDSFMLQPRNVVAGSEETVL